ncbi:hypothetical protein CDN99_12980 [Roseateles aquatilis]|uniref:Uncharacterized protein n=2 Tax=Roseateles aquatilis TaxID=431061 RepID=A0A246JC85_9BURK|nr:hypothetical protein CDN99_12980 [Roseateles aquatilis]
MSLPWRVLAFLLGFVPLAGKQLAEAIKDEKLRALFWPVVTSAVLLVLVYPFVVLLAVTALMQWEYMPQPMRARIALQVREAFQTDTLAKQSNGRLDYYQVIDFHKPLASTRPVRLHALPYQSVIIRPIESQVTSTSACSLPSETVMNTEALLAVRVNGEEVLPLMNSDDSQGSHEITAEQWKLIGAKMGKGGDLMISIAPAKNLSAEDKKLIQCPGIVIDVTLAVEVFKNTGEPALAAAGTTP